MSHRVLASHVTSLHVYSEMHMLLPSVLVLELGSVLCIQSDAHVAAIIVDVLVSVMTYVCPHILT